DSSKCPALKAKRDYVPETGEACLTNHCRIKALNFTGQVTESVEDVNRGGPDEVRLGAGVSNLRRPNELKWSNIFGPGFCLIQIRHEAAVYGNHMGSARLASHICQSLRLLSRSA